MKIIVGTRTIGPSVDLERLTEQHLVDLAACGVGWLVVRDLDRIFELVGMAHRRRLVRRLLVHPLAMIFALVGGRTEPGDFVRVDGWIHCVACGERYNDHAADPFDPWLVIACDGRRLKL